MKMPIKICKLSPQDHFLQKWKAAIPRHGWRSRYMHQEGQMGLDLASRLRKQLRKRGA